MEGTTILQTLCIKILYLTHDKKNHLRHEEAIWMGTLKIITSRSGRWPEEYLRYTVVYTKEVVIACNMVLSIMSPQNFP